MAQEIEELKTLARMADERGDKETALAAMQRLEELSSAPRSKPIQAAYLPGAYKVGEFLAEAAGNIPRSAANVVSGIATTVTSPVETLRGLNSAMRGGIVNVLPEGWVTPYEGQERDVEIANRVGQFYKDRYGGLSNIAETVKTDPVGAMLDVSAITGLGAAATGAKSLQSVSRAVDPIRQTAAAVKAVAKPAYTYGVGQISGSGSVAVERALQGSKAFLQAVRGKVSEADIVKHAQAAVGELKRTRGATYRTRLAALKDSNKQIQIDDLRQVADSYLDEFNVTKTSKGLDFSRSTLSGEAAKDFASVYDDIAKWGSQPGDLTPIGLDVLKRRIGNQFSLNSDARAFTTAMEKAVKNKIVSNVPEYAEMTRDYSKATELIREIEKALGTGQRVAVDTALRKLITAMREEKTFRRGLLSTLDAKSGNDITDLVAGLVMKPAWSTRLSTMATGGGIGAASGLAFLAGSPALAALIAPLMPLASPRLAAAVSGFLGKRGRELQKLRAPAVGAAIAGREELQP